MSFVSDSLVTPGFRYFSTSGSARSFCIGVRSVSYTHLNEVTFPAEVFKQADGALVVTATTEIDRTKWGITFGSRSFFENLGENMVDDMVALDIALIANPTQGEAPTE